MTEEGNADATGSGEEEESQAAAMRTTPSWLSRLCGDLRADRPVFRMARVGRGGVKFRDRADVAAFACALRANTHLESLSFDASFREDPGLIADPLLEDAIASHPSLWHLSLDMNAAGTDTAAAAAIGRATSKSRTLKRLVSSHLGDEGMRALATALNGDGSEPNALKVLEFPACRFGDEGAEALSALLVGRATPEKLVLGRNRLISVRGYRTLGAALGRQWNAGGRWLKELHLMYNKIDYQRLRAFLLANGSGGGINSQLKVLDLSMNAIGYPGCLAISEALKESLRCRLGKLHLAHNSIGPEGARVLADGLLHCNDCRLEVLDLNYNSIGDEGCAALVSALRISGNCATKLKELWLDGNAIGDKGAVALASTCLVGVGGASPSLEVLRLNNNQISLEGCRAIALALRRNSSLTVLRMLQNEIPNEGAELLEASLQNCNWSLEMLRLDYNTGLSLERLAAIDRLLVANQAAKAVYWKFNDCKLAEQNLPLSIWPCALEAIKKKPDLLFSVLRTRPDWFQL